MINVIQGRPGQGKSVYLVYLIQKFLSQNKKVYSNIDLKLSIKFKKRYNFIYIPNESIMSTLPDLREGEVVLDEVQTFLNSRKWDSLPIETQVFLQQHRKRGLNIWGALQSIKRSDKVFRELVQSFYEVRKVFVFSIPFLKSILGLFFIWQYNEDTIESSTGKYERIGFFPDFAFIMSDTFSLYDTTQELNVQKLCPICKDTLRKKILCDHCQVAF